MSNNENLDPETLVAQGGHFVDPATGSIVPPIMPSTTFARDENYQLISEANAYTRDDNPSFETAESLLMQLEGGRDAKLFSSGMAAASTVIQSLEPGDRLVIPQVMYWGLRNWMIDFCNRWNIEILPLE